MILPKGAESTLTENAASPFLAEPAQRPPPAAACLHSEYLGFLAASQRLGANVQYIEKDFWVCWILDVLYHELPPGAHGFCSRAEPLRD
jgi:hypothetical protein